MQNPVPPTPTSSAPANGGTPVPTPIGFWEALSTRLPTVDNLAQFVLVTLLATLAKCGVDDYARNIERTKMVDTYTKVLTTPNKAANISGQNFALITLDRLYTTSLKWYQAHDSERRADDSLVFNIAEEMWRVRKASPPKAGDSSVIDQARLDLAARIMRHRDPLRFQDLSASYELAELKKVRSFPDASLAGTEQPFSELPVAIDRINPLGYVGSGAPLTAVFDTVTTKTTQADTGLKICYIQFRVFPRRIAQQLQTLFQQSAWTAPDAERVGGKYGCSVRYYYAEDRVKAEKALVTTQSFMKSQPSSPEVTLVSLVSRKLRGKVPHGQIEVWISPGVNK
jgi:hypothetical protein